VIARRDQWVTGLEALTFSTERDAISAALLYKDTLEEVDA
jgi:hypothetical protein